MADELHAGVHSGGGSNGAWGWGVMHYLLGDLGCKPKKGFGTSVGSLNFGIVCQFPVGQEQEALTYGDEVWAKVDERFYKHHCPGATVGDIRGVLCFPSVYDCSYTYEFIAEHIDVPKLRVSGRDLIVSVVDLATLDVHYIDQNHPEIVAAVQGSAAYPFFFAPVKFADMLVSDGGLREITPLQRAVESGATFIDVICCQLEKPGTFDPFGKKTLELGPRYLEAQSAEINKNDLRFDPITGPEVTVRLWQPPKSIGSGLDFSQDKAKRLQEEGYEYAVSRGNTGTRTWTIGGRTSMEV
jgi:predicted acylesterase/phospholipase RssA